MSSEISGTIPYPSLISKLPLSFAVPILCSYLFWEHLTAAPSASSAKGLCSLCQGCMNQMESQSARGGLGEGSPSSTPQRGILTTGFSSSKTLHTPWQQEPSPKYRHFRSEDVCSHLALVVINEVCTLGQSSVHHHHSLPFSVWKPKHIHHGPPQAHRKLQALNSTSVLQQKDADIPCVPSQHKRMLRFKTIQVSVEKEAELPLRTIPRQMT